MRSESAPRLRSAFAIVVMSIAVTLVYWPPPQQTKAGERGALVGSDFSQLHMLRLEYARAALFGPDHYLPAWYTREFGGTPFWANMQNFPFIPTRLPLLLVHPDQAFAIGVQLAALLSALFTFSYLRALGIGRVAAAVGGWTFACSGFFASRIKAGHLPLLEASPALPLLLWLIEINLNRHSALRLLSFAVASCSIALAGHPQIPIYSFVIAAIYVIYRARDRRALLLLCTMILGIGLASFALVPMLMLIARSTRVLALDAPGNDVAFPIGRLLAFILPWNDGWTIGVRREGMVPFHGYPNITYFWDTVCYVGWLPLIGGGFLLIRAIVLRRKPAPPWMFIAIAGAAALLFAMPWWHAIMSHIPGTILRSPARQIYITMFALACAAAGAIDLALRFARQHRLLGLHVLVTAAVVAHALDLGDFHDRAFVSSFVFVPFENTDDKRYFQQFTGDQRISIDYTMGVGFNRQIDDIGVFDSILLAKPYRAVQETAGAPARHNTQVWDGGSLPARSLQFFGVRAVITRFSRPDLQLLGEQQYLKWYAVPDPLPRASFMTLNQAQFISIDEIHRRLRQMDYDLNKNLLLPIDSPRPAGAEQRSIAPRVEYRHESTDRFGATVASPTPGYLRLLETWDPGWHATVDGVATPILAAYDCFMAIPISPGEHEVRLTYSTPGVRAGALFSIASLLALLGLTWFQHNAALK